MPLYRLTQRCVYANAITIFNTFHFLAGEGTGASGQGLATDWATNIVPTWKTNVQTSVVFQSVQVESLYPNAADEGVALLSGAGTVVASPATPAVCACVITWRTGTGGRRRRGRTYLAGIRIDSNNGYNFPAAGQTNATNIGTAIFNRYQLGGNPMALELCVFSRVEGGSVPPVFIAAARVVRSYTIQPYIATMGTRRAGRGM